MAGTRTTPEDDDDPLRPVLRGERVDASGPPGQTPASKRPVAPETRMPVSLGNITAEQLDARLKAPIALAARLVGVDEFTTEKLVRAAGVMILDGLAHDGLHLDDLCERARVGRGRLDERFD